MMENKNLTPTPFESNAADKKIVGVRLPCGSLCGHNCADGCIYWCPRDRENGRQYCSHYDTYYYPLERQGCLSFDDGE